MELNTLSLSDFVKLANVIFEKGVRAANPVMMNSGMVKVEDIPQNSGNTREYTSVDSNRYLSRKPQGEQAARGKVQQGNSKVMTMYRIAENIGITYEMMTQNKYQDVTRTLLTGGKKGYDTIDRDLQHRLTWMTSTSYTNVEGETITTTTGDDLALLSTVHVLKGSATTYRNRLANNPKLSKAALEGMERLITEETYNHLGELIPAADGLFNILWTTADPNTVNKIAVCSL